MGQNLHSGGATAGKTLTSYQAVRGHAEQETATLDPGRLMGLAGLLRAWRKAASARRDTPLTQTMVAEALGRSVRWYQDLETGATMRLDRAQCDALADVLELGRDERSALVLYSIGGSMNISSPPEIGVQHALQLLIDKQMPSPTYLTDGLWNIRGFNQAMAEWWPWVLEPGANLIKWALLNSDARIQYHDWPQHAAAYVRLLKFALARHGTASAELIQLINDVCADPHVRHIWESSTDVTESRDGHHFRMSLPARNWDPVEVVSHVLYPASLPDHRLVVITWLQTGDEEEGAGSGVLPETWALPAVEPTVDIASPYTDVQRQMAHSFTGRLSVRSAEEALHLAGDDAIDMPALSTLLGGGCRLILSPSTHSVIWATPEPDGQWGIAEVQAYTLAVRLPHAAENEDTRGEYKILTRAVLPSDPAQAIARIQNLRSQIHNRVDVLDSIHRDLWEADPGLPMHPSPAAR